MLSAMGMWYLKITIPQAAVVIAKAPQFLDIILSIVNSWGSDRPQIPQWPKSEILEKCHLAKAQKATIDIYS